MSKTKLICNKLFSNPFFIALLLTVLVIIIIVAIFKVQKSGSNAIVTCFIYTYICFSIILFVHNIFIKKTMNASNVKKEVKDVFNGIDMSKKVSHDVIQIQPNLYDDDEDIPYIKKRNIDTSVNDAISNDSFANNASLENEAVIVNEAIIVNDAPKLNINAPSINNIPKLNINAPSINDTSTLSNNILNSVVSI